MEKGAYPSMTFPDFDHGSEISPQTASALAKRARDMETTNRRGRRFRSLMRLPLTRLALLGLCSTSVVFAQSGKDAANVETEDGIPVQSDLVIAKCGSCHTPDDKGNLSRISWIRTTPEGWSQAIKRMVRQNGLEITPQESREVIKYLATWHGLAPEEAKPVMYLAERRIVDETAIPNESVRGGCASCHAFAQPLSWRRSKAEWGLLKNLHVALYAQADAQFRHPAEAADVPGGVPAGGKPPHRGDLALDYMIKTAPLHTPEWASWRSRIRAPHLDGKWLVSASLPGKGRFAGDMVIEPGASQDTFKTRITLHSLTDGTTVSRSGTGILYAGYSWRGRSKGATAADAAPDDLQSETRETMWFSPDQKSAQGRWFWGQYQEFGFDVKLTRASSAPAVVSVEPGALKVGTKSARLRILGDELPTSLTPGDIDLGAGVTVKKVVSASPTEVLVNADVASDAVVGQHDVGIMGTVLEEAFPVYRKVDYLKVAPETTLARLGSEIHPKGYQQFDAIGYDNGVDGKPGTDDDVKIGPIDATWKLEEFMSVYYDDDTKYVGTLSPSAFFTPASDGPNPARRFSRNNYGEVWVVATAKSEKDKSGKPLTARSYLVVTVPAYQQWDQPEVSK